MRICSVPGCERPVVGRGWCNTHHKQWSTRGWVDAEQRVFVGDWLRKHAFLNQGECIEWPFSRNNQGYGHLRWHGRLRQAAQVVLELNGFERSPGQEVLHSCDNPSCINRAHIRWGTHSENAAEKFERLDVRPRTTEPCPECGGLHRDHYFAVHFADWYARKVASQA